MSTSVTINITGGAPGSPGPEASLADRLGRLERDIADLRRDAGHESEPFPAGGVDAFLSHFVLAFRLRGSRGSTELIPLRLDPAVQTVARSEPFVYRGPQAGHSVSLAGPEESGLPTRVSEDDFLVRPERFFGPGKEQVWLQILNLDARAETPLGEVRIILGETVRREYDDLFHPSLGVAESLTTSGFPARLFFTPVAIIESPVGTFRTRPKIVEAARVTGFPPLGGPVGIREAVPLDAIDSIRGVKAGNEVGEPAAEIVGLNHPIDAALFLSGEEAFGAVERSIAADR